MATALKAMEADLLGLQEVGRRFRDRSDQAAFLAEELGYTLRFAATVNRAPGRPEEGRFGLAVLSRWPIIGGRVFPLPSKKEPRAFLFCLVETPWWGPLYFFTTHLGLDQTERHAQVATIIRLTEGLPGPVVLTGDFNARPEAAELAPLFARWQEVQAACGRQEPTFPTMEAGIDLIFCPWSWRVLRTVVFHLPCSDHYPLLADLAPDGGCA